SSAAEKWVSDTLFRKIGVRHLFLERTPTGIIPRSNERAGANVDGRGGGTGETAIRLARRAGVVPRAARARDARARLLRRPAVPADGQHARRVAARRRHRARR